MPRLGAKALHGINLQDRSYIGQHQVATSACLLLSIAPCGALLSCGDIKV